MMKASHSCGLFFFSVCGILIYIFKLLKKGIFGMTRDNKKSLFRTALVAGLALFGVLGLYLCSSVRGSRAENGWVGRDVEEILGSMTVREKVCQMMCMYQYQMPNVSGSGVIGGLETGEPLRKSLEAYPIGGILYDAVSMQSSSQLKQLVSTADSYSRIPLFFTIDEEGGRVARLAKTIGYRNHAPFSDMLTYSDQGPDIARANAAAIGSEVGYYGFNLDFAPVADTHSNPDNPVINTRAYHTEFGACAELVSAAVAGFHDAGVGCTLKHFPGHGDTSGDTHAGAVYTYKTLDEIRQGELQPFQAGIDAGADAVMIAHIIVEELGEPCLFSKEIVTELLRDEMGFDGLVISDGLTMKAMTDTYSPSQIVTKGIQAGVDMFLCIQGLEEAVNAVEQAVEDGTISESRLDESVRRILECKRSLGIL